jgi:cell division cycle 20-like protein 1 (cofactor of APC complex)
MIASGGNDNKLLVWDIKKAACLARFSEHTSAVKAVGWNPMHPGILASGGGTADKTLRVFSTSSLRQLQEVDTGSQVCNLLFSGISNEMVSTHGYSLNQINVWGWSKNEEIFELEKKALLTGHFSRVLYLAESPDGTSIVTGAGD